MSIRAALKAYMKRTGKNEVDIAATLKIHPITVTRYLDGRGVRRIVEDGFRRLVAQEQPEKDPGGPEAA